MFTRIIASAATVVAGAVGVAYLRAGPGGAADVNLGLFKVGVNRGKPRY